MPYTVICPSCQERNSGSLMICPKCQTSLVGLPREEYPPVHSKPLIQDAAPLPKPSKPVEESLRAKLLLLLAKTFGIACIMGMIVSMVGWRYLNWHSTRQFSDGMFWAGAASGILGYWVYRNESNRHRSTLVGFHMRQTDNLSMQKRLQGLVADMANSYTLFFQFLLVMLYLFGFSILIWSLR